MLAPSAPAAPWRKAPWALGQASSRAVERLVRIQPLPWASSEALNLLIGRGRGERTADRLPGFLELSGHGAGRSSQHLLAWPQFNVAWPQAAGSFRNSLPASVGEKRHT